jgi:hypothetical protein
VAGVEARVPPESPLGSDAGAGFQPRSPRFRICLHIKTFGVLRAREKENSSKRKFIPASRLSGWGRASDTKYSQKSAYVKPYGYTRMATIAAMTLPS